MISGGYIARNVLQSYYSDIHKGLGSYLPSEDEDDSFDTSLTLPSALLPYFLGLVAKLHEKVQAPQLIMFHSSGDYDINL
jgi:hypothetical protein